MKEIDETAAKHQLREWLEGRGWAVSEERAAAGRADLRAENGDRRWIIEVKGDQENDRAVRNAFFSGVGQVAASMTDPEAKYSLALTNQYERFVEQDGPILLEAFSTAFTFLIVDGGGIREIDSL